MRRNGAAIYVLMPPRRRQHDKHRPCQTLVGLTRPSTSSLLPALKDVDARDKPTAVRFEFLALKAESKQRLEVKWTGLRILTNTFVVIENASP